ncbi:MAG: hypothetical protein PHX38_00785 [Sulfuricella sp.]|nr:hypothetical protein [Sulfuricella sp.]
MSKKKSRKKSNRAEAKLARQMEDTPAGLLGNLQGMLGSRRRQQFILGAVLGAAAVYVLSDEKLRAKLIRTGVGLYSGIAGGFEEMKEQMADIQAEVEAERQSAA